MTQYFDRPAALADDLQRILDGLSDAKSSALDAGVAVLQDEEQALVEAPATSGNRAAAG